MIDILGAEKRRLRTTQEKIAIVQPSFEQGVVVSLVAWLHGMAVSLLFLWRKQYQEGSLTAVAAGEQVIPTSELAAVMRQIKELQRQPVYDRNAGVQLFFLERNRGWSDFRCSEVTMQKNC